MFKEIGDAVSNPIGMLIDDVSLTCSVPSPSNKTNYLSDIIIYTSAIALSIFANQLPGFRYIYLLMEDLWLYYYDKVEY